MATTLTNRVGSGGQGGAVGESDESPGHCRPVPEGQRAHAHHSGAQQGVLRGGSMGKFGGQSCMQRANTKFLKFRTEKQYIATGKKINKAGFLVGSRRDAGAAAGMAILLRLRSFQ